jgi:hypothetical protein
VRLIAALAALLAVLVVPPAIAQAAPVPVYPGMEVRLGTNVCTLGFVDPVQRVAFTAGHCHAGGTVTDVGGNFVGSLSTFRDNTPNGATVSISDSIFDYAGIGLAPDVMPNDILPGGRQLVEDPDVMPQAGQRVCHFGVSTGESCGVVKAVHNGWFTMADGVVSRKGDSGGPVYVIAEDGRAVVIGLFNSTWGTLPAAVSWNAIRQQVSEDIRSVAAAQAAFQAPVA